MAPRDVSFTIRAKDEATAAVKATQRALSELKDTALDVAKGIAATLGAVGLGEFFKQSIEAAAEAEAAWSRMGVSVRNAGGDFAKFRPEAEKVLDILSGQTKGLFEKDSMAGALQKLVEVSGNVQGSLGAMGLVLDLSRAKHMDLESAATLVGRVMTGNTSMLKRYGIVVSESGDAMAELAKKFKGFAESDASTMLGTLDRLKVAWAEFQQSVGKALVAGGTGGDGVIGLLTRMEQGITRNEKAIGNMVKPFVDVAGFLGSVFVVALKAVGSGLATIWIGAEGLTAGLAIGIGKLAEGLGRVAQFLPGLKDLGKEMREWGAATASSASSDFAEKWQQYVGLYDKSTPATPKAGGGGKLPPPPKTGVSEEDRKAAEALALEIKKLGSETADAKTKAQQFAEKMEDIRLKMEKNRAVTPQMRADFEALGEVLQRIKDQESADAFRKLGEAILNVTGDAVSKATAQMSAQLEELRKEAAKVTDPAKAAQFAHEIERLNGLYATQLKTLRAITDADQLMGDAERTGSTSGLLAMRDRLQSDLTTEIILHGKNTDAAKKLQDAIDRITKSYLSLHAAAINGAATLASGILSAGSALGIFDQKTQSALSSVIALSAEVAKLADLSKEGKLFDLGAAGAGWGAAIGAAGSLLGLMFGGDPKEAQRLKVALDNTEAIKKLTDTLHATGLNVSQRDLTTAQSQLAKLSGFHPSFLGMNQMPPDAIKTGLAEFFQANGLDSGLLHSVAASLGITIDDTIGSYRKLAEAVDLAAGRVAKFGDSFSDLSSEYDAYQKIFGVTDPAQLLQLHAKAGAQSSSTIAGILSGSDLNSADGLAAVLKKVQDTFTMMMNGGTGIDMGGLTRDEFIGVLEGLAGDIRNLQGAVEEQTRAIYGVPAGLHLSLEQFRAATQVMIPGVTTPSTGASNAGSSSGGAVAGAAASGNGGTITVNVNLDGKVVARSVIKTAEAASQRVNGTTTEWGTVPSGAI